MRDGLKVTLKIEVNFIHIRMSDFYLFIPTFFAVPELEHPNFMPFPFDFNGGPATYSWGGERRCLEQLLMLDFCNACARKNGGNRGKAICEDPEHWLRQAVQLLWDEGEDQTVSLLWHMME